MDEILDQIAELCAGKSVDEIEEMLTAATLADRIPNAGALARYFFSLAGDEEEASAGPDAEPTADVDLDG